MDPLTIVAFTKSVFNLVSQINATRKLKRERERLGQVLTRVRKEFRAAQHAARVTTDELRVYQEAARATDDIARTMVELELQLTRRPEQVDLEFVAAEVNRLRHSGPLNNLVRFHNSAALAPTSFKDDLSAEIREIEIRIRDFTPDAIDALPTRAAASAIVQACDGIYRIRNRVVLEVATALGNELR